MLWLQVGLCSIAYGFTITSNDGATIQTVTTLGIGNPSVAEVSALSYGGNDFSLNYNISEEEMIWVKRFMADKNFDASDKSIYLLPIKLFQVCLLSSNQEGVYIKVKNDDFVGTKKNGKIQTFVEVVGNAGASAGTAQFLFASSDANSNFSNATVKFFDKKQLSTSRADSFNKSSPFAHSIVGESPLTTQAITGSTHSRMLATETMQLFNHYSILEGAVTAKDNQQLPSVEGNKKNFYFHESSFAENTCGSNNSAVVLFAMYANIKDIMDAENDAYHTQSSFAMCTDATCTGS